MGNRRAREFMMRQADSAAWESVREAKRDLMADVCLPGIGHRRLQVMVVPSFEPGYSWDVRVLGEQIRLFRSEVMIDPYHEPPRLRGYDELGADALELRSILARLSLLSLPIAPPAEGMGGLDGTTYHLALGGDQGSEVRFRWWEEPPPNWQPLGEIAMEMIARFTQMVVKSG